MVIKDSVILITGGSEGIGAVTARALSAQGAKVAVAARSKDKLEAVAATLSDGLAVVVDLTSEASIREMVQTVEDHYGRIDVLINNAGRALRAPVTEISVDDFKQIMQLNVYGPLLALQAVVPGMKARGGGLIVNISSNVSKMAIPTIGAYAATKYALNGLMLTARGELAPNNIIVSVMHPGLTATNFGKNAMTAGHNGTGAPGGTQQQADTPEMVAEKIIEAITDSPAEQYMSEDIKRQFTMPSANI